MPFFQLSLFPFQLSLFPFLLLLLLTTTVHAASPPPFTIDNFATSTANNSRGATALVPHPSDVYINLDQHFPFLAPMPSDWKKHPLQESGKWPKCAWQVATEPSASGFGLLDLNAYYHTLVIWDFDDDDVFRIKGTFPATRYFSFQSYEFTNGKPIASMLDRDIVPATGKNPHRDLRATPQERGTFEIYLTPNGDQGFPNELRAKRGPEQKVDIVTVIYRMYDADPSTLTPGSPEASMTPKQRFWGFAEPAIVERRRRRSRIPAEAEKHHHPHLHSHSRVHQAPPSPPSSEWEQIPPCTDFGSALFQATFTDLYPVFKHFPATAASCPMAQLSDEIFPSLILFGAGLEQGYAASITSYTNFDTRYLYWCAQKAKVGPNIVIRMQGKLPIVPQSLYGQRPLVAENESYDARYLSISTIDMLYPSPTYQEVEDHDIERFYSQLEGGKEWDRTYSIVFALDAGIAQACQLYDPDTQLFLAWNDAYHYGLAPTRMPSIVYRELLPAQGPGGQGKTLLDVEHACRAAGKDACGDGSFIRNVMRETYPQIDLWECDPETGKATVLA